MRRKRISLEELLDIALEVFARYGFTKTTLDDVADRVGMTKANLYNYVENKEDLYHRCIASALSRWRAAVEQKVSRFDDPALRFKVLVREAMVYIDNHEQLQQIILQDSSVLPLSQDNDPFSEINDGARNMLRGVISDGMESGVFYDADPDLVTEYLFSTYMMFLTKRYVIHEGERTSKVFEQCLQIIVRGLIKPEYLT